MKICVYGPGAIGGWLAAAMAKGGVEVSVVARGAHLAAIQANGLTLELPDQRYTVKVAASDNPADLGKQDGVIVTVKAPSLPSVAGALAPLLREDTPVAFLTNGIPWWYFMGHGGALDGRSLPRLDPEDGLRRAVGQQRLIGGIAWPASSVPEAGVIKMGAGAARGCVVGSPDGRPHAGLDLLAKAFAAGSLRLDIAPEIRDVIWEKLSFNLSAGPMCVLTTAPVKDTHVEEALVATSRKVMTEVAALIAAMGRNVPIDQDKVVAGNRVLGHRPSILQDLMAGRPMEVDALYTTPLELADMVGVKLPTLELLVSLIKVRARQAGLYNR
ncbi:MAG: 2-dehydropantoate 2-reductase [Acetobacteraceae bacterium]|nr:2-dehydropantoate 2-reductase [Acetobacteraceae bacterium]